jgi:hypothetical protein
VLKGLIADWGNWRYRWYVAFGVSGLFLAISIGVAKKRGLEFPLPDAVAAAVAIAAIAGWLGIAASFAELIRKTAQGVLSNALGCWGTLLLTSTASIVLFVWSCNRQQIRFRCEPATATVVLGDKIRTDVCGGAALWIDSGDEIYAHAVGFDPSRKALSALPRADDFALITLRELPRWRCFIRGGDDDDNHPFLGCGQTSNEWTRSRSWTVELVPRDGRSVSQPVLHVRAKQPGIGVAIQSTREDCFMNAHEAKDPSRDQVDLSGCESFRDEGGVDRYEVDVTVCAGGIDSVGKVLTDFATITVKERNESYALERTCSLAVGDRSTASR